jgi:lactate dehydrogenase-like 2-hydroxyacid dehydrogenase
MAQRWGSSGLGASGSKAAAFEASRWRSSTAIVAVHPLLRLDNLTITPHFDSATEQTRQRMAEMSVDNLLAGRAGKLLIARVV